MGEESAKEIKVTDDDLAYMSRKLISHIAMINKSEMTEEEKNQELSILAMRAERFGLDEVMRRCGYTVIKSGECKLILPIKITKDDYKIISNYLNILKEEIIIRDSQKEKSESKTTHL